MLRIQLESGVGIVKREFAREEAGVISPAVRRVLTKSKLSDLSLASVRWPHLTHWICTMPTLRSALAIAAFSLVLSNAVRVEAASPNIVFIMADDNDQVSWTIGGNCCKFLYFVGVSGKF
ncbi:MAG: hypothetical protein O2820_05925 [Planctomycetota bacterium]|nr:hypothetical protein [Planctomycetota bacterium]